MEVVSESGGMKRKRKKEGRNRKFLRSEDEEEEGDKVTENKAGDDAGSLTVFPVAYFFSVATIAPVRWALFKAPFPRTTVSRWLEPPPVLLPILVTVSQSSAMAVNWRIR